MMLNALTLIYMVLGGATVVAGLFLAYVVLAGAMEEERAEPELVRLMFLFFWFSMVCGVGMVAIWNLGGFS